MAWTRENQLIGIAEVARDRDAIFGREEIPKVLEPGGLVSLEIYKTSHTA